MFKSSMAVFLSFSLCAGSAFAQQKDGRRDGNVLQLQADAPDQYVVQKGDTLWNISGKFLREPWRWPQVWRLNKAQIKNPHLIYPGNIVRLDRSGANGPTLSVDRLSPRIRSDALAVEAIPTIPLKAIEPYLASPLVIERGGLDRAPRIVATQEGRYNIGTGSRAYVSGIEGTETLWQVYRPGVALIDPETNETLGHEAVFLGTARLTQAGEPATVQILSAKREIGEGDRLVVAPQPQIFAFAPHAPDGPVRARIVSIYDGRTDARTDFYRSGASGVSRSKEFKLSEETGTLSIVSINKGLKEGLEPGHVMAIYRSSVVARDRSVGPFYMGNPRPEPVKLPEERYGLLMVFRVFENISYALTLQAERPVAVGDVVTKP
jgi:nucleoid-associated protein YgaU